MARIIVSASTIRYGPVVWLNTRPTAPDAAGRPGGILDALLIWLANDASSRPQSAPVTSVRMRASMTKARKRRHGAASTVLAWAKGAVRAVAGASRATGRSCPCRRHYDQ